MEPFGRVALIGIGLINGSLAQVLRREGKAAELVAYSPRQATRSRALELGLVDRAEADVADAVRGADLVVIGTPPGAMGEVAATVVLLVAAASLP